MPLKFVDRHNGPRAQEEQEMLKVLGVNSLEELVRQTVPEDILLKGLLNLSPAVSESQYTAKLKEIAPNVAPDFLPLSSLVAPEKKKKK